jgi:uncharacterized protein YllA (UPF0747 family)
MEETKVKKDIDYSASAVNLGDYEPVKVALNVYKGLETKATVCRLKLEETPEWIEFEKITNQLNELKQKVKETIDEYGSYQDLEKRLVCGQAEKGKQVLSTGAVLPRTLRNTPQRSLCRLSTPRRWKV